MPVDFDKKSGIINIHNQRISYIIQILNKYPIHRYFGRYLSKYSQDHQLPHGSHAFAADISNEFPYSVTSLPLEYSTIGSGDYRQPSYLIKDQFNQLIPILKFDSLSITNKPINYKHLPKTVNVNSPVSTLILHLIDQQTKLKIDLNYTIFENIDLINRSTTFTNSGTSVLSLDNATSAQLDLNDSNYSILSLNGTHAHEANPELHSLHSGIQMLHTFRGTSGPQHQPFMALAKKHTTEFSGEVIGSALVWSGNFEASTEVDQYSHTRLHIGLEPTTFNWQLKPQTSFQTPEAILTWSDSGFNGMSQIFHQFSQQLLPQSPDNKILAINTWESMFFDVSAQKISSMLDIAKKLKLELFVLDDGWFINRNSENGQLGDWQYDPQKFPHGIQPLVKKAHNLGIKFGLWVEPEMITQNSQLYKEHPEWTLGYKNRQSITARHQLVLDLSQKQVKGHLLKTLVNLVQDNQLDYLKWDMNRHLTQVGDSSLPPLQQEEIYYRYILGLYDLLKGLKKSCPKLIIENCSAGGGRLDFGMLSFTNQTWISDLTDPIDRNKIANGFSYLFPQTIFSNHVSASPNGQNGRITSLKTRLQSATIGKMGFEFDLNTLDVAEQEAIKEQVSIYKNNYYPLFNKANFYRLTKFDDDSIAWLLITQDKKNALLFFSYGLNSAVNDPFDLPLHYLDEKINYHLSTGEIFSGRELNLFGLSIPPVKKDFETQLIWLKQN